MTQPALGVLVSDVFNRGGGGVEASAMMIVGVVRRECGWDESGMGRDRERV